MQNQSRSYRNLYSETANALIPCCGLLKGEISCDVCIIGAEISGITAAMELSQRGFNVILIEAKKIIHSSLGRNSGEVARSFSLTPSLMAKQFGPNISEILCAMNIEGSNFISWLINKDSINCDMKLGQLTTTIHGKTLPYLDKYINEWEELGCENLQIIDRVEIKNFINSRNYAGGIYDPHSINIHPLNYALGVIKAAQVAGCKVYEQTEALSIEQGYKIKINTSGGGKIIAKFALLAGDISLNNTYLECLNKSAQVKNFTLASEPLDENFISGIFPQTDVTVIDREILSCSLSIFRDKRLLINNINNSSDELNSKISKNFPETKGKKLDYFWTNNLSITFNRLPNIGKLGNNLFYANSYGEYNLAIKTSMGKIVAEAITKTSERFDFFSKIKHTSMPLSDFNKKILFNLYDLWFKIR